MYWKAKSWGRYGDGRKIILNITTAENLLSANVYVGYRRQHPKKSTVKDVLKELQKNNIDVSQLVEWNANHCQQTESSSEGGRCG